MVKKVLLGVGSALILAVLVIVGIALTKPTTLRVEREAVMSAPAAAVFANLDDFRRFGAWSPWEKLDPQMKRTFYGPPKGPGSSYAWSGNDDVGAGKMTIVETRPNERVAIKLEFLKPMESTNSTVYALTPVDGGTRVTWTMEGPNSFVGRIFAVFADMDAMIGKDFETGLANLKRISESSATAAN